eukprot:1728733-Prymnesium_polylepis.1
MPSARNLLCDSVCSMHVLAVWQTFARSLLVVCALFRVPECALCEHGESYANVCLNKRPDHLRITSGSPPDHLRITSGSPDHQPDHLGLKPFPSMGIFPISKPIHKYEK